MLPKDITIEGIDEIMSKEYPLEKSGKQPFEDAGNEPTSKAGAISEHMKESTRSSVASVAPEAEITEI